MHLPALEPVCSWQPLPCSPTALLLLLLEALGFELIRNSRADPDSGSVLGFMELRGTFRLTHVSLEYMCGLTSFTLQQTC